MDDYRDLNQHVLEIKCKITTQDGTAFGIWLNKGLHPWTKIAERQQVFNGLDQKYGPQVGSSKTKLERFLEMLECETEWIHFPFHGMLYKTSLVIKQTPVRKQNCIRVLCVTEQCEIKCIEILQ